MLSARYKFPSFRGGGDRYGGGFGRAAGGTPEKARGSRHAPKRVCLGPYGGGLFLMEVGCFL